MTGITFLGWLAAAYMGTYAVPAAQLDNVNTQFAINVDAGDSCFDRVSGTPGSYGSPENYSLDLACNYSLVKEPGMVWKLRRS